jgi:hypothetical protein
MAIEAGSFDSNEVADYGKLISVSVTSEQRKRVMLAQIQELAATIAVQLSLRSARQHMVTVRPRSWWHFVPIERYRMRVWRIADLDRSLWLGEDGVIYFEHVNWKGDSYFMIAEIWLRDEGGLMRVRDGLHVLKDSANP